VLDVWPIPGDAYQSAGRFSAYLAEVYGLETYLALLKSAASGRSEQDLRAAFAGVLGTSVDDAIGAYEEAPACAVSRWRFHDVECGDLPLVPWEGAGRWEQTIALDCARDDVVGPRPSDPRGSLDAFDGGSPDEIWTTRAIEVPELDGPYRFSIESDDAAEARLEPCFARCFDEGVPLETRIQPSPVVRTGSAYVNLIPAGRYWLRVAHDAASAASVKVVIEPWED
jgi:hypothetical protein